MRRENTILEGVMLQTRQRSRAGIEYSGHSKKNGRFLFGKI
jgi:hypothetical protein